MHDGKTNTITLSGIILLLGNMVPLMGALFLDWELLSIIMVYRRRASQWGIT